GVAVSLELAHADQHDRHRDDSAEHQHQRWHERQKRHARAAHREACGSSRGWWERFKPRRRGRRAQPLTRRASSATLALGVGWLGHTGRGASGLAIAAVRIWSALWRRLVALALAAPSRPLAGYGLWVVAHPC